MGSDGHETARFGQDTARRRPRRRWSLRRRHKAAHASELDTPADVDADVDADADVHVDLVALGEDDQVWTDVTLAALEEPDATDAWMPGPDTIGSSEEVRVGAGPWSELSEDLTTEDDTPSAPNETQPSERELEEEFWN